MGRTATRRCSVCGQAGHDKRRHAGRRQPNPGKRYGMGRFNKPVLIRFGVDKNGKRRAWRSHPGSQYGREFPIGVEEAELLVASGQATVTGGGKLRAVNPAGGWGVEIRMNGLRGTLGPWTLSGPTNLEEGRAERRAAAAIRQMSIGAARAVGPGGRSGPVHYSTERTAAIGRAGNPLGDRMPRAVALATIRAEVAKHGQATQHAIRVYTENRISRDAFNQAVRAGLAQHAARNPGNPDFFRDRFGRPHPVRGTPGYEDAFVGMSRGDKKYLRSGSDQPRGGYTQEASGRALRVSAEKRRSTAMRDRNAGERLARGQTKAQKEAAANRRYRSMGY